MSIKELVHDEALLSTPCEKATAADAEVAQDLLDTMASLDDAACLHANQIGVTHDLFAYVDEKDKPHVMFNPVIKLGLAASKQVEGCFTHEEPVTVTRYDRIKVAYARAISAAGWRSLSSTWPTTAKASSSKQQTSSKAQRFRARFV